MEFGEKVGNRLQRMVLPHHHTPRVVRRALRSAALVPANPAAAEALTWGRPADWLCSLEVLGAWARRGHSIPHNVPWGAGGGKGLRDQGTALGELMVLWGVQEMPLRNREPEPAKLRTHLLIIANTLGDREDPSGEGSFIHLVPGEYQPSQARPCLSIAEREFCKFHIQDGEKQELPKQLKEGPGWTAGYWAAQMGVELELGTPRGPWFHSQHLDSVCLCTLAPGQLVPATHTQASRLRGRMYNFCPKQIFH